MKVFFVFKYLQKRHLWGLLKKVGILFVEFLRFFEHPSGKEFFSVRNFETPHEM